MTIKRIKITRSTFKQYIFILFVCIFKFKQNEFYSVVLSLKQTAFFYIFCSVYLQKCNMYSNNILSEILKFNCFMYGVNELNITFKV